MKVYLVDVSSLFFRAYFAVRPLTSPNGVPVNAIYGFLSMLTKLLKSEKPEYMVFCYDRKEPSFRKDLYEEYKANRSEMPDDLATQIPYIKKLAELLGIPAFEVAGYEADDVIGAISHLACEANMETVIVSGDKDFGQLVGKGVVLYDTMKDVRYDAAGVKEKWGVFPEQMIDYLALVGDTSDNIPGVSGIGPKGACKLLEQFPTIEAIYENIDKVEAKGVREKLIASKANAFLSKRLVTIVKHMDLPTDMETYRLRPCHREDLRVFLQDLNFRAFEKALLGDESSATAGAPMNATGAAMSGVDANPSASSDASRVSASADATALVIGTIEIPQRERELKTVTVDEFLRAIPGGAEAWGFADERGVFVQHKKTLYSVEGDTNELGLATDQKMIRWSGYDLKTFWHRIGAQEPLAAWDSMLAAYVIQAGDCSDPEKVLKSQLGGAVLPELASPSQWLDVHEKLREVLQARLLDHHGQQIYFDDDLPLPAILLRMEKKGIRVDRPGLKQQSEELASEIAALEKDVHELAGETFAVGSPKQLGHILFEKMGLESGRKTKTGFSTDSDVLEKIAHPIGAKVLAWRELSKLKSTYVDSIPELADVNDRVHTRYNQALTTTGRLSSTAPNLQNIPVRTERGQRVRRAFIAAPGRKLLSVDYSQIELRILAHISGDPGLNRAFQDDLDIHAATAAEVFGVPLNEVTSDHRRTAKAVNFGIAYGQGAFGLAEVLGIPRGEAQSIIKRYFERFRGVEEYIQSTTTAAHEKGYVETLFGRRRYIEELRAKNPALKKFGERAAINAPIQGTASDLMKKAMIELARQVPVDMLLQVHDELIFEGPEEILREWSPRILKIMENVVQLSVPLKANLAIGDNWDEAH